MAGAGDCLGYARGVGSARFARSAAAALGGADDFSDCFFVFANAKNKNVTKTLLDVDRVDRQTDRHQF